MFLGFFLVTEEQMPCVCKINRAARVQSFGEYLRCYFCTECVHTFRRRLISRDTRVPLKNLAHMQP